jgi:hypothetical protein
MMARTSMRTMTMIAMTMLPDIMAMVVECLRGVVLSLCSFAVREQWSG